MPEGASAAADGWRISSFCASGACVAVKIDKVAVQVRDTKEPGGATLTFTPEEWSSFLAGVRLGQFDLATDGEHSD